MNPGLLPFWRDIQEGYGDEYQLVLLIRASLLTFAQQQWLNEHKLSIENLLNGQYPVVDEATIHNKFYKPWNDILRQYGLKKFFSEDLCGQAMLDSIEKVFGNFKFRHEQEGP